MKKNAIIMLLCGLVAFASLGFVSCDSDKDSHKLNIRDIQQEYEPSNASLTVNGAPMLVEENIKFVPRGGYHFVETEMHIRLFMALWPGRQKEYDVYAVSHEDYVEFDGSFQDGRINGNIKGIVKDNKIQIDVAYEEEMTDITKIAFDKHLYDLRNYDDMECGYSVIDFEGKTYQKKDYLRLTIGPVLDRMIEYLETNLISVQFNNDFSVTAGTVDAVSGEFKPFPGKYTRLWMFYLNQAYLCADEEGAKFLSKLLVDSDVIDEDILVAQFCGRYYFDITVGRSIYRENSAYLSVGSYGMDWKILNRWYDIFVSEGKTVEASRLKTFMKKVNRLDLIPKE